MSIEDLTAEALRMDVVARAKMVRALIASLEDLTKEEIEALWEEEVLRRDAELECGGVKPVPADEVLSEVRARLK